MWKILFACAIIGVMSTDGASRHRKRQAVGGGAYAGSYAGNGYGGVFGNTYNGYGNGYGSSYSDYDQGGYGGFGYQPGLEAAFIDPYTFHQQLTAQILAQHAAQNNAIVSTFSSGDASVNADASSLPDDIQQQAFYDGIRRQNYYNNKRYKPNRYAPNYASASGSIGPGGYYQSAAISPANPAIPNIHNRFGASSSSPGGYKGVSVSSFSTSSDVGGVKTGQRGAQTTINDNGKVTTYKVHS